MKSYTVIFSPRAERQLKDLYGYIAENGVEARAEGYSGRIVAACQSLSTFPERGTRRDDLRPKLRTMGLERSATIAFSVDDVRCIVTIHGVFYGGQDFEPALGETDA